MKRLDPTRLLSFDKIKNQAYINSNWVEGKSGLRFDVVNPATKKVLTSVPNMAIKDAELAINAAKSAFIEFSKWTSKNRSHLMKRWYDEMGKQRDTLACLCNMECGKPIEEAFTEVDFSRDYVDWFSDEGRKAYGTVVPSPRPQSHVFHVKEPIGVVSVITPWNFPVASITKKVAAAFSAGCTVVIKPAEDTPLCALALADTADQAGFPPGVINVITCDRANTQKIGSVLCQHPHVAGVSFTGSSKVGKQLYSWCSQGLKRMILELGGNAPFIVFSSAKIGQAIRGLMWAKFKNCGQSCIAANRIFIQDTIYDKFVDMLTSHIDQNLHIGATASSAADSFPLGPLINEAAVQKVSSIVKRYIELGANVVCGAKVSDMGALFYEPTILTNLDPDHVKEEIFGPVIPCFKFSTEEEVLHLANLPPSGLAAYFYTTDFAQAFRVARSLEVGMVGVNETYLAMPEGAFGGVKEAGIGREGSPYGVDEFLQVKYVCFGNL